MARFQFFSSSSFFGLLLESLPTKLYLCACIQYCCRVYSFSLRFEARLCCSLCLIERAVILSVPLGLVVCVYEWVRECLFVCVSACVCVCHGQSASPGSHYQSCPQPADLGQWGICSLGTISTHTHTHIHTRTYTATHTHTHKHTHRHTHTHTCTQTHTLSHTHTHTQTHKLTHTKTHNKPREDFLYFPNVQTITTDI